MSGFEQVTNRKATLKLLRSAVRLTNKGERPYYWVSVRRARPGQAAVVVTRAGDAS